jgi:NADH-quinone oxidoreductase subunit F
MKKVTDRLVAGEGRADDAKLLKTVADNIAGRTICAFGEACAWPVQSFVAKFPEEFAARAASKLSTLEAATISQESAKKLEAV